MERAFSFYEFRGETGPCCLGRGGTRNCPAQSQQKVSTHHQKFFPTSKVFAFTIEIFFCVNFPFRCNVCSPSCPATFGLLPSKLGQVIIFSLRAFRPIAKALVFSNWSRIMFASRLEKSNNTAVPGQPFFRFGSKHRYSGRTQYEALQESMKRKRDAPEVQRYHHLVELTLPVLV